MNNLMTAEMPLILKEVFPIPLERLKAISSDILLITSEIETKYPHLYKHLDETPVTFNEVVDIAVTISELENYLETLERQLCNHFNTHELILNHFPLFLNK